MNPKMQTSLKVNWPEVLMVSAFGLEYIGYGNSKTRYWPSYWTSLKEWVPVDSPSTIMKPATTNHEPKSLPPPPNNSEITQSCSLGIGPVVKTAAPVLNELKPAKPAPNSSEFLSLSILMNSSGVLSAVWDSPKKEANTKQGSVGFLRSGKHTSLLPSPAP